MTGSPYIFSKTFGDVKINGVFIEEKGNHNVIYMKIEPQPNEANETVNARIVKAGKPHLEYFRDHELVRTAIP